MQADLLKEANRKLDLKLKQEGMASSSKQLDEAKEIERALKQKDMEDRLVKEQLAMNRCARYHNSFRFFFVFTFKQILL